MPKHFIFTFLLLVSIIGVAAFWLLQARALQDESITIYNYQSNPPYVPSAVNSLTDILATHIERYTGGQIKVQIENIDRATLNKNLREGRSVIAIWVNPKWLARERDDLLYTSPIIWDRDNIFAVDESTVKNLVEEDDFRGMTLAGHNGYYYKVIDEMVENGILERQDYANPTSIMEAVKNGKADIGITNLSILNYFDQKFPGTYQFYSRAQAHDAYFHHIGLTPDKAHLLPVLNRAINALQKSEDWMNIIHLYGMDRHVDYLDLDIDELINVRIE
jgi:ABC-type amino acid transport substrate-binding protein